MPGPVRWGVALAAMVVALAVGLSATIGPARAATDRVALVIGNGTYSTVPSLNNPLADAAGMSAALKRLGFDVVEGYDLTRDGMQSTVRDFAEKLETAKVALVYYAGHGVSAGGENYLIPVDAKIQNEADLDFRTINANLILRQMQRDERVNVFILDACRDNPFKEELSRSAKTRATNYGDGLAKIEAAGTLIAFATDPGRKAFDGVKGENSPFAAALLKTIESPGIPISVVMDRVRKIVWDTTNNRQRPWVSTNVIGEVYLAGGQQLASMEASPAAITLPPVAAVPLPTVLPSDAVDVEVWKAAERFGTLEGYRTYLQRFPNGAFAGFAQERIARLSIDPSGQRTVSDDDLRKAGPGTA